MNQLQLALTMSLLLATLGCSLSTAQPATEPIPPTQAALRQSELAVQPHPTPLTTIPENPAAAPRLVPTPPPSLLFDLNLLTPPPTPILIPTPSQQSPSRNPRRQSPSQPPRRNHRHHDLLPRSRPRLPVRPSFTSHDCLLESAPSPMSKSSTPPSSTTPPA